MSLKHSCDVWMVDPAFDNDRAHSVKDDNDIAVDRRYLFDQSVAIVPER